MYLFCVCQLQKSAVDWSVLQFRYYQMSHYLMFFKFTITMASIMAS